MFVDLVSLFPFDTIFNGNKAVGKLAKLSRIFKLAKIARLIKISDRMSDNKSLKNFLNYFQFNAMYTELVIFMLIMVLLSHILGCIFYFIITASNDVWLNMVDFLTESIYDRYITSVYWVVTTICTVGFGDIAVSNDLEIYLNLIAIIMGVIVYSFLVGMLSTIQIAENAKTSILMNRFNQLNMFEDTVYNSRSVLENITFDLEFYEENMNFLEQEEQGFMSEVSLNLVYKISKFVNKDLIEN